jgi:hypothetical protein
MNITNLVVAASLAVTALIPGAPLPTATNQECCLPTFSRGGERDKSGTFTGPEKEAGSQVIAWQQLASLGSTEAEGTGPATADFRKVLLGHDFCKKS